MIRKILLCGTLFVLSLSSCTNDDSTSNGEENAVENNIKAKWFYYGEEDFDEENNLLNFFDLSQAQCNSGFIIFNDDRTILQEHSDIYGDCEKYVSDGSWIYNKTNNVLTFIENDEDGNYVIKGTILKLDNNELRIRLIQQGDDTDFKDINTQWVFKKQL